MKTHATLYLRLLGFTLLVLALWQGLSNLFESWREFSPTYAIHFLCSELLRPAIAALLGAALMAASRPLARRLTRDLDRS